MPRNLTQKLARNGGSLGRRRRRSLMAAALALSHASKRIKPPSSSGNEKFIIRNNHGVDLSRDLFISICETDFLITRPDGASHLRLTLISQAVLVTNIVNPHVG